MSRYKYCDTIWWITETIKILATIGIVPLVVLFRTTLYSDNDKTIFETIAITVGVLTLYIIYYYLIDEATIKLRRTLRKKFKKKTRNTYSQKKINRIKEQMKNSIKFEENEE